VTALAWAAVVPEMDGLMLLTGAPAGMLFRFTFGHSLLMLPVWCIALASFFKWRYPERDGRVLRPVPCRDGGARAAGPAGRPDRPALLAFGGRLSGLGILFHLDAIVLALLLAPYLLLAVPSLRDKLESLARLSLAGLVVYAGLCAGADAGPS